MVPKFFVGVDISKLILDIALLAGNNPPRSFKIKNSALGVKEFLALFKEQYGYRAREVVFCAEHMGVFATFLVSELQKKKIALYLESPLQIKRSLGIQRGKNDKLDAIRIAQYASKNLDKMRLFQSPRACILNLRYLFSMRKKLLKIKKMLVNPEKLNTYYLSTYEKQQKERYYAESLKSVLLDIKNIEKKMMAEIDGDFRLKELKTLMTSVPRIGNIASIQFIINTNEFIDVDNPKKFASLCGVAPFEYRSGISVSGRTRVSSLANKELKALLHIAAMGYVNMPNTFLGKYYLRKVAEGKNKMSILNAIRNKLIHRVFACVKTGALYKEL